MASHLDFKFEFFNDLVMAQEPTADPRQGDKEAYVAYCEELRQPLTVKEMLLHSKAYPNHTIKSFGELKGVLLNTINAITDNLKKNVDRLGKSAMAEPKDNDINALKQRGIDQLMHLRQQLIEALTRAFDHVHARWINMFDQNHLLSLQKDRLVAELNQLVKVFLKAKQAVNNLETDRVLVYEDLKGVITTISVLKDKDVVDKRVGEFLTKLERTSGSFRFPELSVNRLAANKMMNDFKNLLTFPLDQDFNNVGAPPLFKIKQEDFFRAAPQADPAKPSPTEALNKFIPIIAKNRRLMVYDASVSTFKELLLSDLHSIPHAAQIVVSPLNPNLFLLVGGHYFKKPSDKVFELDATTSQFVVLESLHVSRWMHRTAVFRNQIFVTGGVINDKESPTNSVERYDLDTKKWAELKPMLHARHSHTAVFFDPNSKNTLSIDRKPVSLFVLGGVGPNQRYITAIERLDLDKGFWVEYHLKNSLLLELVGPFCAQINTKELVIFGGFKYLTSESGAQAKPSEAVFSYPIGSELIYELSVEERVATANPHFRLPYAIISTGNQILSHQSKLYFVGGLHTSTFYQDVQEIDFNAQFGLQKTVGTFAKHGVTLLDHILFHN